MYDAIHFTYYWVPCARTFPELSRLAAQLALNQAVGRPVEYCPPGTPNPPMPRAPADPMPPAAEPAGGAEGGVPYVVLSQTAEQAQLAYDVTMRLGGGDGGGQAGAKPGGKPGGKGGGKGGGRAGGKGGGGGGGKAGGGKVGGSELAETETERAGLAPDLTAVRPAKAATPLPKAERHSERPLTKAERHAAKATADAADARAEQADAALWRAREAEAAAVTQDAAAGAGSVEHALLAVAEEFGADRQPELRDRLFALAGRLRRGTTSTTT